MPKLAASHEATQLGLSFPAGFRPRGDGAAHNHVTPDLAGAGGFEGQSGEQWLNISKEMTMVPWKSVFLYQWFSDTHGHAVSEPKKKQVSTWGHQVDEVLTSFRVETTKRYNFW